MCKRSTCISSLLNAVSSISIDVHYSLMVQNISQSRRRSVAWHYRVCVRWNNAICRLPHVCRCSERSCYLLSACRLGARKQLFLSLFLSWVWCDQVQGAEVMFLEYRWGDGSREVLFFFFWKTNWSDRKVRDWNGHSVGPQLRVELPKRLASSNSPDECF